MPLFLVKTFAEKEWIVFPSLLFISKGGGLAWITVPSHTVHEGRDVMGKKLEAGRPCGSNCIAPPLTQPWAGPREAPR